MQLKAIMSLYKKKIGDEGENLVVSYLIEHGFIILETKFKLQQMHGEIDIIAKKENLIVFVEVKRRMTNHYINPLDLVPLSKQKKIISIALTYCQKNNIIINDSFIIRFDIAYCYNKKIFYYNNAFTLA